MPLVVRAVATCAVWVFLIVVCAPLAGCGALMHAAYNNSDFALRRMADDYLDLDQAQEAIVRAQVRRLHQWHRREELPAYARIFASAATRVETGLTRDDVEWALREVTGRVRALTERTIDESVPLVATLNEANLRALEKKLDDNDAKLLKEMPIDRPARQDRERTKRLVERIESFTGDLTEEQQALVMRFVQSQPRLTAERLQTYQRRHRELVDLLRDHASSPDIAMRLRDYFLQWQDAESERARERRAWEQGFVELVLALDRSLMQGQRRHAVKRFTAYADDFRALSDERRAPRELSGASQRREVSSSPAMQGVSSASATIAATPDCWSKGEPGGRYHGGRWMLSKPRTGRSLACSSASTISNC